ncbi:MAG: ribosome biogenesis GTP-binding protein YihA/YsxC [Cyclobacteriaceae bacterium]
MPSIKNAEFVKSSANLSGCPEDIRPEYAFIGRSNVGKSSLINMLTGRNKLAKISSRPGKTQLINHFLVDGKWYLVDLPGYGWAKVSKADKERWKIMIDEYLLRRRNLLNVFLLVDSRHEPQKNDLNFMMWMGQHQIPFSLIFTKIDKLGGTKLQKNLASYREALRKDWEELPPYFEVSNVKKIGGDEIIDYINRINQTVKA